MAKRDYYSVLGVSRDAAAEQIRSSYRKLARKYHPDVNKSDPHAEDKFKEVQEAYDVLSDKQKRSAYDQFGFAGPGGPGGVGGWQSGPGGSYRHVWPGGAPGGEGGFDMGDLGELFEAFTGRGRRGRGPRAAAGPGPGARVRRGERGADLEHAVELSFEEAALGTRRDIRLSGPQGEQTLSIKIPAGVQDGSRIRLRGKGHPAVDGESGDLYIVTHVRPHRFFRREGLDLIVELPLTLAEAALGTRVEVPTLAGKVELTIPPGTSGDRRLRLKGLGVKTDKGDKVGDLYAVARIILPKSIDPESRRLIEEFDRRNPINPRKDLGW